MNLFRMGTLLLSMVFLLVLCVGCGEEKQKSKDVGQAIVDTVKSAENKVDDAMSKMQEKVDQLGDSEK